MKKKKIIIIGILILLGLLFTIFAYTFDIFKPTLYTVHKYWDFPDLKPLSENFLTKYPYIENPQQVAVSQAKHTGEEIVVAKSNRDLNKEAFILLIDGLNENGYIVDGLREERIIIKEREIKEDSEQILITDKGYTGFLKKTILKYKYDKNSGVIYLSVEIFGY